MWYVIFFQYHEQNIVVDEDSLPWCLLVISRVLRLWRASWHQLHQNCVQAPMKLRWSKSFFTMLVLIIFVAVSSKHICLQHLGYFESPFPSHKIERILMCNDLKSQLLSCKKLLIRFARRVKPSGGRFFNIQLLHQIYQALFHWPYLLWQW